MCFELWGEFRAELLLSLSINRTAMSHVNRSALGAQDKWTFYAATHTSSKVQRQSQQQKRWKVSNKIKKTKQPTTDVSFSIKVSERGVRPPYKNPSPVPDINNGRVQAGVYNQRSRREQSRKFTARLERPSLARRDVQSPADVCFTEQKPNIDIWNIDQEVEQSRCVCGGGGYLFLKHVCEFSLHHCVLMFLRHWSLFFFSLNGILLIWKSQKKVDRNMWRWFHRVSGIRNIHVQLHHKVIANLSFIHVSSFFNEK